MEVVDAVTPLWRPGIGAQKALHFVCQIATAWKSVAVEEHGKRTVGHPTIGFQVELLRLAGRRRFHSRGQGLSSSYARRENAGSEVSAIDRLRLHFWCDAFSEVAAVSCRRFPSLPRV